VPLVVLYSGEVITSDVAAASAAAKAGAALLVAPRGCWHKSRVLTGCPLLVYVADTDGADTAVCVTDGQVAVTDDGAVSSCIVLRAITGSSLLASMGVVDGG
jgi:hypothetical protein